MKKWRMLAIMTFMLVLALMPALPAAGENTTLSVTRFKARGGLAGFVVMDATGCIQTAASILTNLSFEQVLPEPTVEGKALSVALRRIDLCAGAVLLNARGTLLNPVLTVDKDLRSASVSAESVVLLDDVTLQNVNVGPIEVTWTAEGQLTAESGMTIKSPPDFPFVVVSTGTHKFRVGQAQGSVFFEGIKIAGGGSRFAEIIEAKSMTIEIKEAP